MSYTLDTSGTLKRRQATLRRPYRTIVLALMVVTSSIASIRPLPVRFLRLSTD